MVSYEFESRKCELPSFTWDSCPRKPADRTIEQTRDEFQTSRQLKEDEFWHAIRSGDLTRAWGLLSA
eukprot:6449089-Lingulodinium_polyedra.AAC.1